VKDEYTLDFLELGEGHSERELEPALIARIEDLLRAMGGRLAFMGSQYRLGIDGEEFFIDLLLFHRRRVLYRPAAVPPSPMLPGGHRSEKRETSIAGTLFQQDQVRPEQRLRPTFFTGQLIHNQCL